MSALVALLYKKNNLDYQYFSKIHFYKANLIVVPAGCDRAVEPKGVFSVLWPVRQWDL